MEPLELVLVTAGAALLVGVAMTRLRQRKAEPPYPPARERRASPRPRKHDEDQAPPSRPPETALPRFYTEEDDELDVTRVTVPSPDESSDERLSHEAPPLPIVYDEEAALDAPTANQAYILVFAAGSSDVGMRRRTNEDSYLMLEEPPLFAIADGMGGYAGGEVASRLAVDEIGAYFARSPSAEPDYPGIPRRGAEVVRAIRRANRRIYEAAENDRSLEGMGTTVVCARFSPNKQRLYLGHVGDSRCYLLRDDTFSQVTTDHTVAAAGIGGPLASTLTRALGVKPAVSVDLILGKPRPGDRYLLCSDGLSKMVDDARIRALLEAHDDPEPAVDALIAAANEEGGRDNVTVVVIRVDPPPIPS